ncbi:hypothetical protein ACLOJK_025863 [Asimina triloba]
MKRQPLLHEFLQPLWFPPGTSKHLGMHFFMHLGLRLTPSTYAAANMNTKAMRRAATNTFLEAISISSPLSSPPPAEYLVGETSHKGNLFIERRILRGLRRRMLSLGLFCSAVAWCHVEIEKVVGRRTDDVLLDESRPSVPIMAQFPRHGTESEEGEMGSKKVAAALLLIALVVVFAGVDVVEGGTCSRRCMPKCLEMQGSNNEECRSSCKRACEWIGKGRS